MIYICKCGKNFSKSGNAATTGFRDTDTCRGCPHLLPYGENYFDDVQRAFVLGIKGYECRASQFLRYQTELSGALDDKTTIHIESLDFDFLERVSNWVKEHYPNRELFGSFSRENIRSAEYTSDGRYRYSLSCSQNKKGIAAKRALWAEFFDETYHRTDMSAEEETEKVLKDIQLGIERAKEAVLMHYKDENTGWVYRVSPQPGERDLYFIEYLDPSNSVIFKRLPDYPGSTFKESSEEVLVARAQRNGWTPTAPLEIAAEGDKGCDDSMLIYHSPIGFTCQEMSEDDLICKNAPALTGDAAVTTTESAVKLLAGAEETSTTSESAEDASTFTNLSEQATPESGALANEDESAETCCCSRCQKSDCVCAGMCDAQSRAACDGRENCSQSGCTYDVKHLEGVTYIPFAATAVDAEPVADPARSASDSTMEATVAGDCVATENVEGVTAVSLPDGKEIDVPAGFDYSGLDAQTVADLHLAEREFAAGKRLAEMGLRRMAEGVAIAHDALCGKLSQLGTTQKHGNRGEDTFKSWCESIGVSRSAAYRMLNVVNLFDKSTPRQQKVLDVLAPSVLYEASRPSAEPQAVEALRNGKITTLKQYKELEAQLKEAQERAERAEREAQEAKEKAHRLETRPVMSELYDANQRIKELENRPIEVATQAPTEEQINEAAKPVIQEMTAMYKVQQEQQREQIRELKAIVAASRNAIPNACRAIAESCAEAFARGFEEFQAMAQDLSDDEYMNAVEPIFEACREIIDSLEGADYVEG